MNTDPITVESQRAAKDQISPKAQLFDRFSLLSLLLTAPLVYLLVAHFADLPKESVAWLLIGSILPICGYFTLRDFGSSIYRAAWVAAHAPARTMWIKRGRWSNDLYDDANAPEAALKVANITNIKERDIGINLGKQSAAKTNWNQREQVLVQSDTFLDGSAVIRCSDQILVGTVTKSPLIPGFKLFSKTIAAVGPRQHLNKAEMHIWVFLVFPGTVAFMLKDALPYSLFGQACLAATALMAIAFALDLPMRSFFSRFEKDLVDGKNEKHFEHRVNRLAVMCLRYRKNSEADLMNEILASGKTGKDACQFASAALASYLASENKTAIQSTVSPKTILCLSAALMVAGMAYSHWRTQQVVCLVPPYYPTDDDSGIDKTEGTLSVSARAINLGKDSKGVNVQVAGSAFDEGLLDHPHAILTSKGSGGQSQTEDILLRRDASGDWRGQSKSIALVGVGPLSFLDYFDKQLTVGIKADLIKTGSGTLRLQVAPLNGGPSVRFNRDVQTENPYEAAPATVTSQIPFVLYPGSLVTEDKNVMPGFVAFSSKTTEQLPKLLAYYKKQLSSRSWKTEGLSVQKGVRHVSFNASKGKETLTGDAWAYGDYCKIYFEIESEAP